MHLINLTRHTERLARMRRIGAELGIEWQVFNAVDGTQVRSEQDKFDPELVLSEPEFGCFLSHRKIWQLIADGDEPIAGIFEDDLHCAADLLGLLGQLPLVERPTHYRLEAWENCRAVVTRRPTNRLSGRNLHRFVGNLHGSAAYVINRAAARLLVEQTKTISLPVDWVLTHPTAVPRLQTMDRLVSVPAPCTQDRHLPGAPTEPYLASSILDPWPPRTNLGQREKLAREIARPFRKAAKTISDRYHGLKEIRILYG